MGNKVIYQDLLYCYYTYLSFHRWAKIQNVPYIPDFDIVQRELKMELEAKIQQERLVRGNVECIFVSVSHKGQL